VVSEGQGLEAQLPSVQHQLLDGGDPHLEETSGSGQSDNCKLAAKRRNIRALLPPHLL
jgi:hypothetical protein